MIVLDCVSHYHAIPDRGYVILRGDDGRYAFAWGKGLPSIWDGIEDYREGASGASIYPTRQKAETAWRDCAAGLDATEREAMLLALERGHP